MNAQALLLHDRMRRLWEDHVQWTRHVVVSAAKDLPDLDANVQRLMRNQDDFGRAFLPFVGPEGATQLTALLRQHIAQALDVVKAAKANDTPKLEGLKRAWYGNADRIAAFLSAANPRFWPLDAMRTHMRDHLDLTLAEASQYLLGKYPESIATYGHVRDQILQLSDILTFGLTAGFPHVRLG